QYEGSSKKDVAHDLHGEDEVHAQVRQQGHDNGRRRVSEQLSIHFTFPKSPAGRSNSTMAMMMKTTVLDASGQNTLVSPSMTPRPRPVRMAPRIDPMPPTTTTANTTMIRFTPISGEICRTGAASTPAKPASATT